MRSGRVLPDTHINSLEDKGKCRVGFCTHQRPSCYEQHCPVCLTTRCYSGTLFLVSLITTVAPQVCANSTTAGVCSSCYRLQRSGHRCAYKGTGERWSTSARYYKSCRLWGSYGALRLPACGCGRLPRLQRPRYAWKFSEH